MHQYLAHRLSRYYTRADNDDIVFCNGMNLGQMAGRMAESEVRGIEDSSVSRFLSGERLPQLAQLRVFCDVLALPAAECWELEYALARDRCARYGIDLDISASPIVVNLLVRNVESLGQAIDKEDFNRAIDILHDLYLAKVEIDGEILPSAPFLRVVTLVETERANLMYALSRSSFMGVVENLEEAQVHDHTEEFWRFDLPASLHLSEVEKRLWQQYYVDGRSIADIAASEELTEATVYSIFENLKSRLLQYLADHGDAAPRH